MTTTTPLPRKFRRAARELEKKHDDDFNHAAREARATLARPAPLKERVPVRDRPRLPVARPVMKDPRAEIRWAAGHVGNRVAHHTFRIDLHARTFWCAVGRGVDRTARYAYGYVTMPEGLVALARIEEWASKERYAEHAQRYAKKKKGRRYSAASMAGVTLLALLAVVGTLGLWSATLLAFLVVPPALAVIGRRRGPVPAKVMQLDTRPVPLAEGRPSPTLIHDAFAAAGIDGIICETAPHRAGPGWETIVRIPLGKQTFADAVKVHGVIAGNLGIGSECLFLTPVRGHGGSTKHARVWHTRVDPFAGDPPSHPLLDPRSGPADLWNSGLPIGLDARGTIARIAVIDTPAIAVIGQPGAGKTFLIFGIGIAITADPTWDADVWSFKDSDDYAPLKPLVKACGGTYDYGSDSKTIDRFVRYLIRQIADVKEQNEALGDLPIDQNPNAKVERDVAAARGSRFRPKVIICDEIITAIEGDDRVLPLLEELNRIGRSLNRVFVFGAQFADSGTFENLQKLIGATICLSVKRWQDSKGALGSDHVPGVSEADKIPLSAKGVGFVAGALDDPEIGSRPAFKIRTFRTDRRLLADHVARCLATVRAGQGARVDLAKADADPFRCKIADLFKPGETALTCMELGQRLGLGEGNWAGRRFADQAREHGIEPQVDTGGVATGSRNATFVALDQLGEGA